MTATVSDLIPFHVWERNEPLRGWICVAPGPGGTRVKGRCPGCGTLVGDDDMWAVANATGEAFPQTPLYVHIAYAFKRRTEREATDVVADAPDDAIGADTEVVPAG